MARSILSRLVVLMVVATYAVPALAADCRMLSALSPGGMSCCGLPDGASDTALNTGCCRMNSAPMLPMGAATPAARVQPDRLVGPAAPVLIEPAFAVLAAPAHPPVPTGGPPQDRLYLRLSVIRR